MSYLLDTNVISELVRKKPAKSVVEWIQTISRESLFISVLTIGELRYGIEKIAEQKKKEALKLWLDTDLKRWFQNRELAISIEIANKWGFLQHKMQRPIPVIDSLLAATAIHHDLKMVTRNEKDFQYPGLELINPWHTYTRYP